MSTIVALGCSNNRDYEFLIPFTALFWRDVIGFEPLVLLVGDKKEWVNFKDRHSVVEASLLGHEIMHVCVGRADGYADATMAQNCRQHAVALGIKDDVWVMPGDADLWPLNKEFYQRHEDTDFRMVSYYWNGDHFQGKSQTNRAVWEGARFQTLPTCHVAMRAALWREVYGLEQGIPIAKSVQRTLDTWIKTRTGEDASFDLWMSDQDVMTARLCAQEWFPSGRPPEDGGAHEADGVLFVGRQGHPPNDRLDRSHPEAWLNQLDVKNRYTDAHVHRSPYKSEVFAQLLPLVAAFMPQHLDWALKYFSEYTEASQ